MGKASGSWGREWGTQGLGAAGLYWLEQKHVNALISGTVT